jgi:hypothetical protein
MSAGDGAGGGTASTGSSPVGGSAWQPSIIMSMAARIRASWIREYRSPDRVVLDCLTG